MQLSPNFHMSELTVSQTAARRGLNNTPGKAEIVNLSRLCKTILQPLRDHLKRPILVTSGYRSPAVNQAVGGSGTSAHCFGLAADIHVPGMTSAQLMATVRGLQLPVDQCIDEFGSWVHVGLTGGKPRNQYLSARFVGGRVVYTAV
jgi:hypothetical protein